MAANLTEHALFQLLAWSSPGYPTGAFSYSHGLEWAVETGEVTNLQTLLAYITAVVSRGGGWVDAVLFAHAWRAVSDEDSLDTLSRSIELLRHQISLMPRPTLSSASLYKTLQPNARRP